MSYQYKNKWGLGKLCKQETTYTEDFMNSRITSEGPTLNISHRYVGISVSLCHHIAKDFISLKNSHSPHRHYLV